MDIRRELYCSLEVTNPKHTDIGELFWGVADSVTNDAVRTWGQLDYDGRLDFQKQILAVLDAPLVAPKDFHLITLAAKICGRLGLEQATLAGYRRLTQSAISSAKSPEAKEAQAALINLVASLSSTESGSRALKLLVHSKAIPSQFFPVVFQGYLRRFPTSFAVALTNLYDDLRQEAKTADWRTMISVSARAIDLPVLADTLADLPYLRFDRSIGPNSEDHTWVLDYLFLQEDGILSLRESFEEFRYGAQSSINIVCHLQRDSAKTSKECRILIRDKLEGEHVKSTPFKNALEYILARAVAKRAASSGTNSSLAEIAAKLYPRRKANAA